MGKGISRARMERHVGDLVLADLRAGKSYSLVSGSVRKHVVDEPLAGAGVVGNRVGWALGHRGRSLYRGWIAAVGQANRGAAAVHCFERLIVVAPGRDDRHVPNRGGRGQTDGI